MSAATINARPASQSKLEGLRRWFYADPPFVLYGAHSGLAKIKFWIARLVRLCWYWRDVSPGIVFLAVTWTWGHSPIRLLPFPLLPLWLLTMIGAVLTVWAVRFDSHRGHTANKDREGRRIKRLFQRAWVDLCREKRRWINIPDLKWPEVFDHKDVLHVAAVAGTSNREFMREVLDRLPAIYKAPVKIHPHGDGSYSISIHKYDPLKAEPTLPVYLGNDDGPDLQPRWDRMPLGIDADGDPFTIRLFENHILVNGQTGSGKSSSMVAYAVGCIAAPDVEPVAMEPARKSFACLRGSLEYVAGVDACLQQLKDEHAGMEKRHARMEELDTSLLMPSARTPLRVIFIDEMQNLLDPHLHGDEFVADFRKHLADILDRGRAVGYSVIGICTNPRKTILTEGLRDQFTYRLVFKVADRIAASLGLGVVTPGYEPDLLPKTPGRCVLKSDENYQLRTYRIWDATARDAGLAIRKQTSSETIDLSAPRLWAIPGRGAPSLVDDSDISDVPSSSAPRRRRGDARTAIIDELRCHGPATVVELSEVTGYHPSTVKRWLGLTGDDKPRHPIQVEQLPGYRYGLVGR